MDFIARIRELFTGRQYNSGSYEYDPGTEYGPTNRWRLAKRALSNPAFVKVLLLNCDLFSMGKIYCYAGDKEVLNDPLVKQLQKPNHMQVSFSQYLWEVMFWWMLDGNYYGYFESFVPDRAAGFNTYVLDPHKIDFPPSLDRYKDKLILSRGALSEIMGTEIKYDYDDGSNFMFKWRDVVHIPFMNVGSLNWFVGPTPLVSLRKVLTNTEKTLDSWNVNLRFSGKFLVAGTQDPKDVTKVPLSRQERTSIQDSADEYNDDNGKAVKGVKSMVEIKRYIDDLRKMALPEQYMAQYFVIGSHFGIPKDVLESYLSSSTFENQEKSTGKHISYSLQPKGDMLMSAISQKFGYLDKSLVIDWEHLPFMQAFAKDRADVKHKQALAFKELRQQGVSLDSANEFLDTTFKLDKKDNAQNNQTQE